MKETKLNSKLLHDVEQNNGLKVYLSGLSLGREATQRSNLYNLLGKTRVLEPEQILDLWLKKLSSLKKSGNLNEKIYHFDLHQLEKWGPQGQVAPIADLMDEIVMPTFSSSGVHPAFQTDEWQAAKRLVVKSLHNCGCKGLSPVPFTRVVDDMRARDTLESNSGWPLYTRRHKPEVVAQSCKEAEDGRWKTYPAIALFRNYNNKTRLVWMFPMSVNLVEGSFFQPLQQRLMLSAEGGKFLSPWRGFETVRKVLTDAYMKAGGYIAATDFSSTDAHFKLDTSMEVYDVISQCFQPRYREALKESLSYMHSIPLVISPTSMLEGNHGVSSGSNWTNFIETIFDWILTKYFAIVHGDNAYHGLYAIGDDMTWVGPRFDEHFAKLIAQTGEEVGQLIKEEKATNNRDDVVTLQRLVIRGNLRSTGELKCVYPTIRALKSLVYPEKFHKPELWSKDMEAVRAFMILENCVDHPLFEEFCAFVAAGDPNLATVARMSRQKQNSLLRQSKLVPGLNPTYNQEKRDSSLSNFDSVKFIAKL